MPIYTDSYKTTEGSVVNIHPIEKAIKEAIVRDSIDKMTMDVHPRGNVHPLFLTGVYPSETQIPSFTHPIIIFNYQGKDYLCTDIRTFIRKGTTPDDIMSGIRNKSEVDFAVSRSVLNLAWVTGGISEIRNNFRMAAKVYSSLIAGTVAREYNLDFRDETLVLIAAEYFYRSLFIPQGKISEETKEDLAIHTIKSTNAPSDLVHRVFDNMPDFNNITDWCKGLQTVTENPRLQNFNFGSLLELLRNAWGYNEGKRVIAVALEHPPTWCAMVYAALTDRGLKNSAVARVAERISKRGAGEEYLRAYIQLVNDNRELSNEDYKSSIEILKKAFSEDPVEEVPHGE